MSNPIDKIVEAFLLRKTRVDHLPFKIVHKRLYILPTSHGLVFILILFAMLMGSINYNNNLGFLLVFLLGSITLISIIHTYRNLLGLTLLSASATPVFASRTGRFQLLIRSGPVGRRNIGYRIDQEVETAGTIDPETEKIIEVNFPTTSRGIFRPARITVRSRYPLGLFRTWAVIKPDISCVVYPRPLAGRMGFSADEGQTGAENDADGPRPGVDDFAGLKTYQPGDPLGRVSWKSISRGLGMFTKEFTGNAGNRMVMLDFDAIKAKDTEEKLSRLCDMVLRAHNMNLAYGLRLPGRTIAPDKGEQHKHECLKALAVFK